MARIPFAIQSYRHRSLPVSAQRLLNWMAEVEPKDAKSPISLLPTPGLTLFATCPQGPVRGVHLMGAYLYVVSGSGVYRLDVTGAVLALGLVLAGGPVTMADNGTQVIIVVPEAGLAWVATATTLAQVTDTDLPNVSSVTALDGYGIVTKGDSSQFYISSLNDMTAFDALDFATAEASPDNLVRAIRIGEFLWLFGERTIEVWSNTGAADFPFQRINGGVIPRGTAARGSVATVEDRPYWLGENRVVYAGNNTQAQRISTHAIEQAIAGYAIVSDARAWTYEQEGHAFYVLTFPDAKASWLYDLSTQLWHERESEGYGMWRCGVGLTYAGAVIAGDTVDGRLWIVDPTASDEGGSTIIRVATGTPLQDGGKRLAFGQMIFDMETGIGIGSGQGSDPQVFLSWSDDGGRTFGNEVWRSLGRQGAYRTRVRFNRLGSARERVFRLAMSDPVRTALVAVEIDATPMAF